MGQIGEHIKTVDIPAPVEAPAFPLPATKPSEAEPDREKVLVPVGPAKETEKQAPPHWWT